MYSFEEISARLRKAISILQERDAIFLDSQFNISERAVTHRLGMYLAELFPDEDVDCEYNRQYNEDTDEYIAKNVDLPKIENGITLKDTVAKTVYPDIIIHRRQRDRNILVIEVKMQWKSDKVDFDHIKAEAYKRRLGYKFSVVLVLDEGGYELNWVK